MWKTFWYLAALVGSLSVLLVWTSAKSEFLYKHPGSPQTRIVVDPTTGAAVVMKPVAVIDKPLAAPSASVPKTDYDFGTMNPSTAGRHAFVIKNEGAGPLTLKVGETSCKCTVSGVDKNEVPPGDQATVSLDWTTGTAPLYSHYATIHTNDPARKSIDFVVHGKVLMLIGAETPEVVLGEVTPGEVVHATVNLYSQIWDSFTVSDLQTGLPGLQWEVAPVNPAESPDLQAKAMQKLHLTIPADVTVKDFSDLLRLTIVPAGESAAGDATTTHQLDVPIHGKVRGQVVYFGADILGDAIDFGTLPFGKGRKSKVLVKVRDPQPELGEIKIETFPASLRARLVPHAGDQGKGLYDLHIEIPADTPSCQYLATPQGHVRMTTSHPRVPNLEISVRFAVLQKSAL